MYMYNLYLCFFYSCILLSCTGVNKSKPEAEPQNFVVDIVQIIESEPDFIQEDIVYEESSLQFFNPIGLLGNGLINVELYVYENQESITIDSLTMYNDPECLQPFCSYDLNSDLPKGKDITPIYNSINYGWYCFVCTDSNDNSYEIAINQTERKYLKKEKNIKYYTWEGFFDSVFTVNPTDENPLREFPSDSAAIVNLVEGDEPEDYHQKVKLEDEWLHLKYEKSGIEGWLRWRNGKDIIVDISISW